MQRQKIYMISPDELASIPTVCGSLREALTSLESDHDFLYKETLFNVDQLEGYMDLKWEEVYAVDIRLTLLSMDYITFKTSHEKGARPKSRAYLFFCSVVYCNISMI